MVTTLVARDFNGGTAVGVDAFDSLGGGNTAGISYNTSSPIDGSGDIHVAFTSANNAYGVIDTRDDGNALNEAEAWPSVTLKPHFAPSANVRVIRLRNGASTTLGGLQLTTTRRIRLVDQGGTPVGSDSDQLTLDSVYEIGLRYLKGAAGAGVYEAYLKTAGAAWGTAFASGTHSNDLTLTSVRFGLNDNGTADVYLDNVLIGDSGFGTMPAAPEEPSNPAIATLVEAFTGAALDTSRWGTTTSLGATVPLQQDGHLELDCITASGNNYAVLLSVGSYDLTGSALVVQTLANTLSGANTEGEWDLQVDGAATNRVGWYFAGGNVEALYSISGSNTFPYSAIFDATAHRWLRIREAGGTVYWDSSADGLTWTNRASVSLATLGWAITALRVEAFAGTFGSQASPGHLWLDNLNNPPSFGGPFRLSLADEGRSALALAGSGATVVTLASDGRGSLRVEGDE